MKRLVYAPKVYAYVKADSGVYDLTEYITAGRVERKLDQVSTVTLTIRNPNMKWTDVETADPVSGEKVIEPVFHPMDPITVIMERLQGKPVQVFTGFCDTTPYLQLHPGTIDLSASCTLKKLEYTFYDAGLPFFDTFLSDLGWSLVEGTGAVNLEEPAQGEKAVVNGNLTESGFGKILLASLEDIGNWPKETIYIEKIPTGLIELVTELFEEGSKESQESNEYMIRLLHKIIGTASLGEGEFTEGSGRASEEGGGVIGSSEGRLGGVHFTVGQQEFGQALSSLTGLSLKVVGAWMYAEENGGAAEGREAEGDQNWLNVGPGDSGGVWEDPISAARETNKTLHNGNYDNNILASIGKSDQDQLNAIIESPWGTQSTILETYTEVNVTPTEFSSSGEAKQHGNE